MVPPTPVGLSDMAIFSPSRRGVAICDSPTQPAEGLASAKTPVAPGGSQREAIAWACKCPAGPNEMIEIRQVQEMADFPEEVKQAAAGFEEMQRKSRA